MPVTTKGFSIRSILRAVAKGFSNLGAVAKSFSIRSIRSIRHEVAEAAGFLGTLCTRHWNVGTEFLHSGGCSTLYKPSFGRVPHVHVCNDAVRAQAQGPRAS